MPIFVVAAVGRQVEGDNFLHVVEAAFKTASAAESYVVEKGKVQIQTLPTQHGDVECAVQRVIFPVEVSE